MWYIYTMEFNSAIKRNASESVLMRWMNLEPIIQSEVSQKEKNNYHIWASLVAQLVKNLPAMWETWVRSLGWDDPLEKGKATYSYSGPETSMDYTVLGVAKSQT